MRTAAACFALAAAIATPGIVVAATSSGPGHGPVVEGVSTASGRATPLRQQRLDPRLRPVFGVVRDALAARGQTRLTTFAPGPGAAELVQLPKPGERCPIFVLFRITDRLKGALLGSPCGHGSVQQGNIEVDYTPKSLGPTIRLALASLTGGNSG